MSKLRGRSLSSKGRNNVSNKGFTLLELMIVMVVVAIGVALAVPSFQDVLERRETTAQAEELSAFLAYAQSEAIKSNDMISVQLTYTDANNWCIGANEGIAGCDCRETDTGAENFCSLNGVVKILSSATHTRSSMSAHSTDTLFAFDPIRGTMVAGDLGNNHGFTLQSDNANWSLQVDIGVTGRIIICNPDTLKKVPGYKACPVVGVVSILPPPLLPPALPAEG